jgi:hypothetical protein
VRLTPKSFRQRRPDGDGWIWGLGDVRRVPYRLPQLLAAPLDVIVFIAEGEKDVDNLVKLGVCATTAPGGAGKWRDEYSEALRSRQVVILPDADEPGRLHAKQVAKALAGIAASVRVVTLMGLPAKGDVSDWISLGGTKDQLLALAKEPPPRPNGPARTSMDTIEARPVEWRWRDRLQAGAVASIEGLPGAGKSTFSTELVACVTAGRGFYGDSPSLPKSALWIGHEESLASALRPRLDAAGADPHRVFVYRDPPSFPSDYAWLAGEIRTTDAGLVVIDPIDAYLDFGETGDSHRNGDVRVRLRDLAVVAEGTGATILMVRHWKKTGGVHAVYRSAGSLAYSAMARAIISVLIDPDDPNRRIATWSKMSDAPPPPSLAWRVGAGRSVVWIGEDDRSAQALMDRSDEHGERTPSALDRAVEWLRENLSGGPVPSAELQRRAQDEERISERTLKRARESLGVQKSRDGKTRTWYSSLPRKGATIPLAEKAGTLGALGTVAEEQEGQEGQGGQESFLGSNGHLASEEVL